MPTDAIEPVPAVHADVLRLGADPSQLHRAREFAGQAALISGLDRPQRDRFVYAVNEAVTNAIKHGLPDAQGMITLSVTSDQDTMTFTVYDSGHFDIHVRALRNRGDGGRGLALMARLVDRVDLQVSDSGTTVHLSKQLGRSNRLFVDAMNVPSS